ncbi:stress response translation initiation inhibitor YciH [Candidatus Woesearchaeota archaeon]|nr:stress response translation initiation inhibitor YciH [Candidatus Woesearchaeota archaeon]
MSNVCTTCGLPEELCVCESIAKETQKIEVRLEKKKFNKTYTVIDGIDPKEIDIKDLAKKLKAKLACGGTVRETSIELQGAHMQRVKETLTSLGFPTDRIVMR